MLILRLLLSTGKRTALLGLFAAAAACEASNQPVAVGAAPGAIRAARTPSLPEPPSFETRLPLYPSPVLYIVGREYVLEHGLTSLDPGDRHYQQYVERRLRQLYPGRGHAGMVSEAVAE